MSFDDWFLNQYKCLDDEKFDSCEDAWNAGAQSRQAEIDELQKNFNTALKTIEIQQRFLDDADGANKILTSQASELQKRIDLIVDLVRDNTPDYWLDNMIQDILKGTTNEQ